LYATAQSEPLPVGNFRFLEEAEIRDFDLDTIEADAEIGYIVDCDLSYPAHLHDMHNVYPMAHGDEGHAESLRLELARPGTTVDTQREAGAKSA